MIGICPAALISSIASFASFWNTTTLNSSHGSRTSIRWWRTPSISSFVTFADPISMWRYTCMESALMISPPIFFASSTERAVFPDAVGPVIMIKGFFIIRSS